MPPSSTETTTQCSDASSTAAAKQRMNVKPANMQLAVVRSGIYVQVRGLVGAEAEHNGKTARDIAKVFFTRGEAELQTVRCALR